MLKELQISNFAIIDALNLSINSGLNIFTGETGAGKSIILDAVSAVLGAKADTSLIREGCDRATVDAVFEVSQNDTSLRAVLIREDLLDDDPNTNEIILSREIRANGRSTCRINGHSANSETLREIGGLLVDIHGQSDHLSLLNPAEHIRLLDRFAGNQDLLKEYQSEYYELSKLRKQIRELRQSEDEILRRKDILCFQINEINVAKISDAEEEKLLLERTRLANAETLSKHCHKCLELLEGFGEQLPGALESVGGLIRPLEAISRVDDSLQPILEQAISLQAQMNEVLFFLSAYSENLAFDPHRFDQIEERLIIYENLKKKYGGSVQAVSTFAQQAQQALESIEHAEEHDSQYNAKEDSLLASLSQSAAELSRKRTEAAVLLRTGIEQELHDLGMVSAEFSSAFTTRHDEKGLLTASGNYVAFNENGFDQIEFLIAANPGEGFKSLAKTASGGETSRLMLAVKNTLAHADTIPTMIFDEIDQGIGGRVGSIIGQKLWQLSAHHQVLCITHLPQLAVWKDTHYHVRKQITTGRTQTIATKQNDESSLHEIAAMLGAVSAENLRAAEAMIADAERKKQC